MNLKWEDRIISKTKNHLKINGKRIEIAWHGPGPADAPTLVLLHEGLGCVSMWRNFPKLLAEATGCGALVYSRLGYGNSDPCPLPRPIHFMHDEAMNILPEILKIMEIENCVLIGHSDGGSIALIYAGGMQSPAVKGLVTEAAHVFCEEISVQSIREAKEAFIHGDLKERLKKHHGPNTDCAFWGWNDVWLHPEFIHWNIEEFLSGITVPILAIQGENDQYGTKAQVETIKAKVKGTSGALMLESCKHHPHLERKELTLKGMTRFVMNIFD